MPAARVSAAGILAPRRRPGGGAAAAGRWLPVLLLLVCGAAGAAESVSVCFNYGCAAEAPVTFSEPRLVWVREMLAAAQSAPRERELLALVVGQLYGWAAEQTPVGNDRAGNFADGGMPGQMDCIDHSTTTTRFLRMIEERGWLRFHRVLDPVRRSTLIFQHYSAAIEDLGDGISIIRTDDEKRTWAVDSWYADNGRPAWVAPLDKWERDDGPDS